MIIDIKYSLYRFFDMENSSGISRPKVFGIGLQKTGTTTLGACLTHLGYRHKSYDRQALWHVRKGRDKQLVEMMDRYDSFDDEPWARIYRLADQRYPDAKFILTVRKSSDAWFNSLAKHCDRLLFNEHRRYLFGSMYPRENRQEIVEIYENHIASVKDYFEGREGKLLVVSFDGDSQASAWEKICDFLGCEVPNVPVPRMNAAPSRNFPEQTKLRTWLYIPKYVWIVTKQDFIRPSYKLVKRWYRFSSKYDFS